MSRDADPRAMARQLNPVSIPWYYGLPAVTAEIDCGGEGHRITWRRGKLVLEDHDVLAEQSLTALGAKPPICLEVLHAWRAMRGSELLHELLLGDSTLPPEELALRRASHEAEIESAHELSERMRARLKHHPQRDQMVSQLERQAVALLEREKRLWAITLIEALPPGLRRRLGLSAIVKIERHWHDDEFRRRHAGDIESALTAIVAPLFEQSARRWRRNLKPYAIFVAESWLVAPGEAPMCAAWADSGGAYAALSLPLSWFVEVWARGIALVDGCFVLEVVDSSRDRMKQRVLALRWERHSGETSKSVKAPALVARSGEGDWHLQWV